MNVPIESLAGRVGIAAGNASNVIAKAIERIVVLLMVVLVVVVWLGILARYVVDLPITWTEEASRYLMIWVALLAVSIGIVQRSHIGVLSVFERLDPRLQRMFLIMIDTIAFCFFDEPGLVEQFVPFQNLLFVPAAANAETDFEPFGAKAETVHFFVFWFVTLYEANTVSEPLASFQH